jgi:hypothetical protein
VVHRSDRGVVAVSFGAAQAAASMTTATTGASTVRIAATLRTR